MISCKRCDSENIAKSGIVRAKQRFRCKKCGYNFRFGDSRTNEKIIAKKALCILWYSMDNCSFRMMGKLLQIDHTLVYRWIQSFGESLPEPKSSYDIKQLEFDELWCFVDLKKETFESLKQLIMKHEKLLPEFLVNEILQRLDDSMIKLSI
ncbi:MAG: hypothetical protein FWC33_03420 [Candidatus Bathyarchaeota archaeon]|nr:hypothetical protein [Candidatus Termiticorpusculum sp.]